MKTVLRVTCASLAFFLISESQAQTVLEVGGDVDRQLSLTMTELKGLPTQTYAATSMQGDTTIYDVVRLIDVLVMAGAPTGSQLRGQQVQKVVVVTAGDGYRAVFSLAELDPKSAGCTILLAIGQQGKPLDKTVGPLRIIAPNDQLHSRWVREVTGIFVTYPNL